MKKKMIVALIGLLVLGQLMIACQNTPSGTGGETGDTVEITTGETEPDTPTVTITLKSPEDGVSMLTNIQKNYLKGDYDQIKSYALVGVEQSLPEDIMLSWSVEAVEGKEVDHYVVELSEKADFSESVSYQTSGRSRQIYNLKLGTKYYWRVSAIYKDGSTDLSGVESFTTSSDAPRVLNIGGVPNSRDLGGWKTTDGGTVKQGMIYRTEKLTADYGQTAVITDSGIDVMKNTLGIKTEIDLRYTGNGETGGLTKSILGDGVQYYALYADGSDEALYAGIRDFFALAADESNYPMVIHCSAGTDRTGWISYLVNGLLGVAEADLYRDYLFSNFGPNSGFYRLPSDLNAERIQNDGVMLRDKIYLYLRDVVGVPEEDLLATIALMRTEDSYEIGQIKAPDEDREWSKLY